MNTTTRSKTQLPIIDIPNPCAVPASEMVELDGKRELHCFDCAQSVYNLTLMTTDEARAILDAASEERGLCVRFLRRADGSVQTSDCGPTRLTQVKRHAGLGARRALSLTALVITCLLAWVGLAKRDHVEARKKTFDSDKAMSMDAYYGIAGGVNMGNLMEIVAEIEAIDPDDENGADNELEDIDERVEDAIDED